VSAAAVVAVHRLPAEVEDRVREACDRAGARTKASDAIDGERPALLVAHLPRGARRIPPDVIDLASRTPGELPLILACDEKLVHPSTTLCLGGVTLVQHAARERLYSQIRIALTASGRGDATTEHAGPHWWLATTGSDAVGVRRDDGLSAVVPFAPIHCAAKLAAGHVLVRGEDAGMTPALVETFGRDAGFVHLSREARSWVIYWPAGQGGLWLYSSHRLPHLSELSRPSDVPRVLRSVASPGEIVLASARPLDTDASVASRLADGGPAALDRLRATHPGVSGFVVEVR